MIDGPTLPDFDYVLLHMALCCILPRGHNLPHQSNIANPLLKYTDEILRHNVRRYTTILLGRRPTRKLCWRRTFSLSAEPGGARGSDQSPGNARRRV